MLATSYSGYGFGRNFGQALTSLFETAQRLQQEAEARFRQRATTGFGGSFRGDQNIGAFFDASARRERSTFIDSTNKVFCRVPDRAGVFRVECFANSTNPADSGPFIALQEETDQLLNLIPAFIEAAGKTVEIRLPDGGTRTETISPFPRDPVNAIGGGYDGKIGSGTMQFAVVAMLLAAALSRPPDSVTEAFLSPTAVTFAIAAPNIAGFFQEVRKNFQTLLQEYIDRGRQPAADLLVPETVVIIPGKSTKKAFPTAIVGAAAAMIGLTTIAVVNAAKKQPHFLYGLPAGPALGRRKNKRGRKRR